MIAWFLLALYIIVLFATLPKIFAKAGAPAWKGWVPLLNLVGMEPPAGQTLVLDHPAAGARHQPVDADHLQREHQHRLRQAQP
jgi:hypothetical protein